MARINMALTKIFIEFSFLFITFVQVIQAFPAQHRTGTPLARRQHGQGIVTYQDMTANPAEAGTYSCPILPTMVDMERVSPDDWHFFLSICLQSYP
jgi:hypothetical protein